MFWLLMIFVVIPTIITLIGSMIGLMTGDSSANSVNNNSSRNEERITDPANVMSLSMDEVVRLLGQPDNKAQENTTTVWKYDNGAGLASIHFGDDKKVYSIWILGESNFSLYSIEVGADLKTAVQYLTYLGFAYEDTVIEFQETQVQLSVYDNERLIIMQLGSSDNNKVNMIRLMHIK